MAAKGKNAMKSANPSSLASLASLAFLAFFEERHLPMGATKDAPWRSSINLLINKCCYGVCVEGRQTPWALRARA